jgi:hypothetical protein
MSQTIDLDATIADEHQAETRITMAVEALSRVRELLETPTEWTGGEGRPSEMDLRDVAAVAVMRLGVVEADLTRVVDSLGAR